MKDIFKIAFSLTIICVAAAMILGVVFAYTDHARKVNEEKLKKEIIQGLLGYGGSTKTPENLQVFPIYRYVIARGETTTLGYVVPTKDQGHALVEVDVDGQPVKVIPIKATEIQLAEQGSRDAAVSEALGKDAKSVYAESFYIANLGNERLGYVVPGVTQGFKTFIDLMISMDPKFTITGVEITRSEEDPGLGDEIKRDFFKQQFVGKNTEALKGLKVIKEPMPAEYYTALEPAKAKKAGWNSDKIGEIKHRHLEDEIYALTGATISSKALTTGVKETARKFVYRLDILNEALKKQNVQAAF